MSSFANESKGDNVPEVKIMDRIPKVYNLSKANAGFRHQNIIYLIVFFFIDFVVSNASFIQNQKSLSLYFPDFSCNAQISIILIKASFTGSNLNSLISFEYNITSSKAFVNNFDISAKSLIVSLKSSKTLYPSSMSIFSFE